MLKKEGGAAMDTISVIKTRILSLCAERNITINKLATMCALPPSSVKNILYGRSTDPKILTIKKLCDGLDITLGEFFSTPEFDALEQEIK
jgi:transcriptional regulator with XRE-family HTH domain